MESNKLKMSYSLGLVDDIKKLDEKTKEELLFQMLSEMSNDKNSSTFREGVTLGVLGIKQSTKKLGYDSDDEPTEVKPKNLTIDSIKKFDGSGNFSDFTWKRHKKYQDDNVKMVVSGFLDGKLMFLVTFNYNSLPFIQEINRQLQKQLPKGDELNRYVRSVKFSYKHFKDSDTFKIEFLSPIINEYEFKFTKPFFKILKINESIK
jgi:hypothetical protein